MNPKSEIFTTFEKIHCLFLSNLKSEETKSQIKAHLSYLANSYFYNYKSSLRILHQHRVLWNLKKNKDIVITKPDKGNGVVILDRKLYNNPSKHLLVLKTSWRRLEDMSWRRLQHLFSVTILRLPRRLEDVLKKFWRRNLLGISVSNKSIFSKSTFHNSKANPKCIK